MNLQDLEIEQHLLGSLLKNNIPVNLTEKDFIYPDHWQLFKEIQSGKKVFDYLGTSQSEYVTDLVDFSICHFDDTINNYVQVLKKLSAKRDLVNLANKILYDVESKDATEIAAYIQNAIEQNIDDSGILTAKEITKIIANETELPPNKYSTGFEKLDNVTGGGFYEGFTYGFCGAEKSGKTTLAHSLSYQLGTPHLYVAMEMGAKQIHQRNLARSIGINSLEFYKGGVSKNQIETAHVNENAFYADQVGATLDEILSTIRTAKLKHGITGYILDYWQLVSGQEKNQSEEKHLRDVAQGLANFNRKNGLWCVLLAQMNQDGKLFGGNGLRKACDQLYMIKTPEGQEYTRWLDMDASRYTIKANLGDENTGWVMMNPKEGPYFYE